MTGKITPLRERDTSTVQAAADALLSSPRYASPNTRDRARILGGAGFGVISPPEMVDVGRDWGAGFSRAG